jgi:hypothetical protein
VAVEIASFPYSGPTTVDASRYEVTTHASCSRPPRSPTIVGSAVDTIVWSSDATNSTRNNAPKIRRRLRVSFEVAFSGGCGGRLAGEDLWRGDRLVEAGAAAARRFPTTGLLSPTGRAAT